MSPERYARGSSDWIGLHFQYPRAGVVPADYDYFAITARPRTLGERYAGRRSVRDLMRPRSKAMRDVR